MNSIKVSLLIICFCVSAEENYNYVVIDKIRSVYDGDTFRVDVKEWPALVGDNIPIRLRGIDTPEIRGSKCVAERRLAYKVRDSLRAYLNPGSLYKLLDYGRGTFFRVVGRVTKDGKDVGEWLIDNGYAQTYTQKEGHFDWCSHLSR